MPKPLLSKLIAQAAIGLFCVLFGCVYGFHSKDRIFLLLSILIGVCCLIRTFSLYRLIHAHAYRVIEGTCTRREQAFLRSKQQILLTDFKNQEYRFSLDKNVKLLQGHHYRLYFRQSALAENTSGSYQDFLGFEELATINSDKVRNSK